MKNTGIKLSLLMMAFCGMLALNSCKQEPKVEDTEEVAKDQNDAALDNNEPKQDDSEYLVAAAGTDMAEIELGKLAQSKGTDAGVKDLGKMMVDQHTKASAETKALADKKGVALPMALTDDGKAKYDDLNKEKPGMDFDKKFADMMVAGHEDAIKKIEDASKNAKEEDVKMWASNMLPTLNTHLEHAKMVQEQLKNKK